MRLARIFKNVRASRVRIRIEKKGTYYNLHQSKSK
jgi:hypothetical protein